MPRFFKKMTSMWMTGLVCIIALLLFDKGASAATLEATQPPLKIAFVYVGPVGQAGWTFAHDQARLSLESQFGDRISTSFVENVAEGVASEKVFRELAQKGNQLIIGTTFGYMDSMLKVAKDFPKIKFEHATGYKTAANLATFEVRTYEGAYLAGIIAGKTTRTNKLGFVASVPIPEVIRNINAFTLGAQSVNRNVTTDVVWINEWVDPAKERDAALKLIQQGADVLIQNTDSNAVIQTAQEKGVMAFGWDSDMSRFGEKAHLGSVAIKWAPYYVSKVKALLDGNWKTGTVWLGIKEGTIKIVSPNPKLAADLILFLGERSIAMRIGKLKAFQGPIIDQSDKQIVIEGSSLDDQALKNMKFYVKGVLGSIPK